MGLLDKAVDFVKDTAKDAVDGLVGDLVEKTGIGSFINEIDSIFGGIGELLLKSGLSFKIIDSIAGQKLDSVISNAFEEFTGFSGKCPERASAADISANRQVNPSDTQTYYQKITPQGKIESISLSAKLKNKMEAVIPFDSKYFMTLRFYVYDNANLFKSPGKNLLYTVKLPLPPELLENTGAEYETKPMKSVGDITQNPNVAGGAMAAAGMRIGQATVSAGLGALKGMTKGGGFLGNVTEDAMDKLGIDEETISSAIEQTLGVAPNPNPAVLFKGPLMREFTFSFMFHARNEDESSRVRDIIKRLKGYSLPTMTFSGDTGLLNYPPQVMVNFYPWDSVSPNSTYGHGDHTPLRIKRCFLSNVNVNYAPDGIPAFFGDAASSPVYIQVSLTLKEIEFLTAETYFGKEYTERSKNQTEYITGQFGNNIPQAETTATETLPAGVNANTAAPPPATPPATAPGTPAQPKQPGTTPATVPPAPK